MKRGPDSVCPQVSDAGLVEVGKGCEMLEWLDVSRSDLNWKITDIGLLGIAEGCHLLKTLVCQGCELLTDVACAWVGRGCPTLNHLDLKNCSKITNGTREEYGVHMMIVLCQSRWHPRISRRVFRPSIRRSYQPEGTARCLLSIL